MFFSVTCSAPLPRLNWARDRLVWALTLPDRSPTVSQLNALRSEYERLFSVLLSA